VGVDGAESVGVSNRDHPPVGGLTPAEHHGAGGRGANGGAPRSLDVDAAMPPGETAAAEA
jgi:hypothetical protein